MKAITVQQPWAWAIIYAGKNLENRSVPYKHRGPLLIHAAAKRVESTEMPRGVGRPDVSELALGAVIGVVEVVDVVDHARSKWFSGPYALVLESPRALKRPVPWKGQLGLWTAPPALVRAVRRQVASLKIPTRRSGAG